MDCHTAVVDVVITALPKAEEKKFSTAGTLAMLSALSSGSIHDDLLDIWLRAVKVACPDFDKKTANRLLQHIIMELLPVISKEMKPARPKQSLGKSTLTKDEERVLYYAAGSISRKLILQYKKYPKNKAARLYKIIVWSWVLDSDEEAAGVSADVTQWTDAQDRGRGGSLGLMWSFTTL